MANFIQSRVYLIHQVQAPKPTDDGKETKPKPPSPDGTTPKPKPPSTNKESGKSVQDEVERVVGGVSVARRLMNTAFQVGNNIATLYFQDAEFKQTFMGNSRGAEIVRQQKQFVIGGSQILTSGAGAVITSVALGNPAILAIWAAGQALQAVNSIATLVQQTDQYNKIRERDMYASRYSQDRLFRQVYNRRS